MRRADPSRGTQFAMSKTKHLIARAMSLVERLEHLLPTESLPPDWSAHAFRWRRQAERGSLQAVHAPHRIALEDLLCLERQKEEVERNARQFLAGNRANNVLLWGSRGTGKSSLVKAVFNTHRYAGLRLIEVDKDDLIQLPDILELLGNRPERFILYCDDLSFEASESGYKALKAALDGSITATPDNLLIYATSNRRHLLPEFHAENREARILDGELHQGESVEEKISLSDRFGLWVAFHPFSQAQYLTVVRHWLRRLHHAPIDWSALAWELIERDALQWALQRGSRSGRTAWQFALDWAGREENPLR
jgi:predicted AAA+ superfamily ATPase